MERNFDKERPENKPSIYRFAEQVRNGVSAYINLLRGSRDSRVLVFCARSETLAIAGLALMGAGAIAENSLLFIGGGLTAFVANSATRVVSAASLINNMPRFSKIL